MKTLNNTGKLIVSILFCEATGFLSGWIGSAFKNPWFDHLQKPSWNPPGYIFGPVWTTLYLLMGISFWLIWKKESVSQKYRTAKIIFIIQLCLNFCWSIIFFRLHSPGWAFVDIILLLIVLFITIFRFSNISKTAAWLLVPYIAWVCFASCLNFAIWKLN